MNLVPLLRSAIHGAWRWRILMTTPLLFVIPISLIAAFLWPTKYETSTLVLLQEYNGLSGDVPAYVRAQDMRDKIKSLDAMISSEFILRRILKKYAPDGATKEPTERDLQDYRKRLSLKQVGTQFVLLTLTGNKQEGLGRELSSILAALFESLLSSNDTSLNASTFLQRTRRKDLAELEERLRTSPALARSETAASLQAKRQTLHAATAKTSELAQIIARDQRALDSKLSATLPDLALQQRSVDVVVSGLRDALAKSEANSAPPDAAQHKRRITNLKNLIANAESLQGLTKKLNTLSANQGKLKADLDLIGSIVDQREQWQREAEQIRARYGQLESRGSAPNAAADIQLLRAPARIQVIDTPKDPKRPLSSKLKIIIAGILAAFVMSLAFGVLAEQMDGSLRGSHMLREVTGVPVIAEFAALRTDNLSPPGLRDTTPLEVT